MKKIRSSLPLLVSHRFMKLCIVLLTFLILPVIVLASSTAFRDVAQDSMYYPAIEIFQRENLIIGDTAGGEPIGQLRPRDYIKRAEFSKLTTLIHLLEGINDGRIKGKINDYLGVDLDEFTLRTNTLLTPYYSARSGAPKFSDVSDKDINCAKDAGGCNPWYTQYVNYMGSLGTVKGYSDGTFRPENSILRIHALKMIMAENGNIPAAQDSRYQRLASDERIKLREIRCLAGAEEYILAKNDRNLLDYALLADKLDLFGNKCQVFTEAGFNSAKDRAAFLQSPLRRQEVARYFALTTSINQLQLGASSDVTVDTKTEYIAPMPAEIREEVNPTASSTNSDSRTSYQQTTDKQKDVEVEVSYQNRSTAELSVNELTAVTKTGRCCPSMGITSECRVINYADYAIKEDSEDGSFNNGTYLWNKATRRGETCWISFADIEEGYKEPSLPNEISSAALAETATESTDWMIRRAVEKEVQRGIWVVYKERNLDVITREMNRIYGTNYSSSDIAKMNGITNLSQISDGAQLRIGTLDGWQPPKNPDSVDVDYWDDLGVDQQKILHYHRNSYQPLFILPSTEGDWGWREWDSKGETGTHNVNADGNIDYRGLSDQEGQQAIYDSNGNLVLTPENMGTYDYEEPTIQNNYYRNHAEADVRPWIEWGNSPQDKTTKRNRICAMSKSRSGRLGLDYLNYKYDYCE